MKMTGEKRFQDPLSGEVIFRKSRRCRRISIRVHPVRGICVSVPWFLRYDDGMRFYMQKREWVCTVAERQRERLKAAEAGGQAISMLSSGSRVRTLLSEIVFSRMAGAAGEACLDTPEPGRADAGGTGIIVRPLILEDVRQTGRLYLSPDKPLSRKTVCYPDTLPEEGSAALSSLLSDVLVKILRDEAKSLLPVRLSYLAGRYGMKYKAVSIKHNISNWGSCSALGNINLNLNLVRLPEPVCDYVLLHELAHLRYRDHGVGFHGFLEEMCADNMLRLSSLGDPYADEVMASVRKSRSARPYSHVLEREVKKYRLL